MVCNGMIEDGLARITWFIGGNRRSHKGCLRLP
jgi:hypothetical protein